MICVQLHDSGKYVTTDDPEEAFRLVEKHGGTAIGPGTVPYQHGGSLGAPPPLDTSKWPKHLRDKALSRTA